MWLGVVFGLASAFVWATTSLMVKAWSDRVDTLTMNTFRMITGAVLFIAMTPFFGGWDAIMQISTSSKLALAGSVFLGVVIGDSIYFWSMTQIGAARAMPISGIYPLFTWAIAVPLLNEPVTWQAIAGTLVVIVSLYLLAPMEADATNKKNVRIGVFAAIFAAFMWAVSTTLLKIGLQDNPSIIALTAFRTSVSAIMLMGLAGARLGKQAWRGIDRKSIGTLILLNIYSAGMGMLMWTLAVDHAGAARASLLVTIAPIIGAPLAVFFLREKITVKLAVGTVLSIAGIWLIL